MSGVAAAAHPDGTRLPATGRGTPRQYLIALVCAVLALLDGFDGQITAFAAPKMAADFGVLPTAFGPAFSAGMVGALIGTFAQGSIGDRIGRRTTVMLSFVIIGVGTGAAAVVPTLTTLAMLRLVTGFGLGAALPNLFSITSEYAPPARRYLYVTVVFAGLPFGAVVGAMLSAFMLSHLGWRALFLCGGALSLLMLVPAFFYLPESLAFLTRRGRHAQVRDVLDSLGLPAPLGGGAIARSDSGASLAMRELFTEGRGAGTLLLWTISFLSLLVSIAIVNWLPTILSGAGVTIGAAVMSSAALNGGGLVGSLTISAFIDRHGYGPMAIAYLIGSLALLAIGMLPLTGNLMTLAIFLTGLFFVGGQMCLASLAAYHYPQRLRAKAIGWSIGLGRIGGIVGTLGGGVLLTRKVPVQAIFQGCAAIVLLTMVALLMASRVTRRNG